jgi:hypothetical protein
MAMITAILISFVVLTLAATAVGVSDHVLTGVGQDRKRVYALHAAEAGIDRGLLVLASTPHGSLPCASPMTGTLQTDPGSASYSVEFTYYASFPPSGTPLSCPLAFAPAGVVLTSTGDTSDLPAGRRRLELAARITPSAGGGYTKAVFSDDSINFDNSLVLSGNVGNDAVLYTNGDYNCDNSQALYGYVLAQGAALLSNSCHVNVDVWANLDVTLENNINVGRDVMSSTSSVTLRNAVDVGRNVVAGTTVTLGNNPDIGGQVVENNVQPAPPYEELPELAYTPSAWAAAGYTINDYGSNCASAVTALDTQAQNWTSPTVVRVTNCLLNFANLIAVDMRNNIAIVNEGGGFDFGNNITFRRATNGVAAPKLYLIAPFGSSCSDATPSTITLRNNIAFESPVSTFLYTPCLASLANSGQMLGQVYAGSVLIRNNVNIAYRPMGVIPGTDPVSTTVSDVAIVYKRESPA